MPATDVEKQTFNSEHTLFTSDHWWEHLIVFLIITTIAFLYNKYFCQIHERKKCRSCDTKLLAIIIIIAFALMILIITLCDFYPKTDQKHIMEMAGEFLHHNYSSLNKGEYLDKFPQQYGIILFYMVLSKVFGCNNYIAFEIVNAVLIALTYWTLANTASKLNPDLPAFCTAIESIIFIPYLFYSLLVYGIVIGLFLSCCSIALIIRYIENGRWCCLIASSICIAMAIILKPNYYIFFIAETIYIFFIHCAEIKAKYKIAWFICSVFLIFSITAGIQQYIRNVNDGILPSGIPKAAWIAMGLQDGNNAPGWYNGYNTAVYEDSDYNTYAADMASRKNIQESIQNFTKNPTTIITFVAKKIQSQWNNPTFQVLWELEGEAGRMNWIVSGRGRMLFEKYCNWTLSFIYGFALLYWTTEIKSKRWNEILYPLIFLGGFSFHLFWEAQCLYAMPYMIMLLPMSSKGIHWYCKKLTQPKNHLHMRLICVTMTIVIVISYTTPFHKIFARNDDDYLLDTQTQSIGNVR